MLKLVEVVVLLCAGALFFIWQWRDLHKAREHTRRQREATHDATRPKDPNGT